VEINKNTLYLVATPIGNLDDITLRGKEVLSKVDFIAAEDTRNTLKLLNRLGIKKPMVSYFEHNKRERGEVITDRIINGESCALVTDAGLPAISDPGEDIVKLCVERNITVCPIPGPCAAVTALCASGLPTGRFVFEGFLSTAKKSRAEHLLQLKDEQRTMIFYEAPHKLLSTLRDLRGALGERNIVLARELTKIYEEFIRITLSEAIERFSAAPPKGEFVLIVEGKEEEAAKEMNETDVRQLLCELIGKGMSKSEAAKEAAKRTARKKSDLYKLLLEEKKDS